MAPPRTTYSLGMLQSSAYRILIRETNLALKPFRITATEWAVLGLIYEHKEMLPGIIAKQLGVEASFVTHMTRRLKERLFISEKRNTEDNRKRCIVLTATGSAFVVKVEETLRVSLAPLVHGVAPQDLAGYIAILQAIQKNAEAGTL